MPEIFFAVTSLVLTLYSLSSFPSLPGGDSGELLADSCLFGTSHPPGYPTFLLLSHFIDKLYTGPRVLKGATSIEFDVSPTVAWKVNTMCCIFGAFSAGFIAISANEFLTILSMKRFALCASSIAAGLFAFAPLVWEYSISAEVFALNNLILSAIVYLTIRYFGLLKRNPNPAGTEEVLILMGGSFLSALSLTNQHASIIQLAIMIPFVVLFAFRRNSLTLVTIPLIVLSFAIGLLPYYYLVIASAVPKKGSWGDMTDLAGLLKHFLRAEYGTFRLGIKHGSESALQRIWLYLHFTSTESWHSVFLLVGAGAVRLYQQHREVQKGNEVVRTSKARRRRQTAGDQQLQEQTSPLWINSPIIGCIFCTWLFYLLFWHGVLSNLPLSSPMPFAVHSRFWMQPNIPLVIMASVGVAAVMEWIAQLCEAPEIGSMKRPEPQAAKPTPSPSLISRSAEVALLTVLLTLVMRYRFPLMDKSQHGWVTHKYSESVLRSLPKNSVLVTHTDLDWNAARYLQSCEHMREDVTLLSLQLMPFPWFPKQQQPLYPQIKFPDTNFPGVSTERSSEGNAQLVRRFLFANGAQRLTLNQWDLNSELLAKDWDLAGDIFSQGFFLDMQAVNEAEIESGGQWRNLTLMPWGAVYRVLRPMELKDQLSLQPVSLEVLRRLQKRFPAVNEDFVARFPAGSWEFAAASVYYDAHYQLALNCLSTALEMQNEANMRNITVILDRLHLSTELLGPTLAAAKKFGTLSSSLHDVHKNTALAWMRMQGLLSVCVRFRHEVDKHRNHIAMNQLIWKNIEDEFINIIQLGKVTKTAGEQLQDFVDAFPSDKDAATFAKQAENLKSRARTKEYW